MFRWLAALLLIAVVAMAGLWVYAGRTLPPTITIHEPTRFVGQKGTLRLSVNGPQPDTLTVALEQNGKSTPLFSLDNPGTAKVTAGAGQDFNVERPIGKAAVPELAQGDARIVAHATRKSIWGIRTAVGDAEQKVTVRLEPPRVAVLSTHHYINQGGSELVVYRVSPPDVVSGVRVGDLEYLGYPAAGAGIAGAPSDLRVAFFALLAEQAPSTPIQLFARDEAGNQATAGFVDKIFPKVFKQSRIPLDDAFLSRVVPEIVSHSPELKMEAQTGDMLPGFLRVNGDLRRMNAEQIAKTAAGTSAQKLWTGPFVQLGNSQVEAGFADRRTYLYKDKEVDKQTHLGFDLAVTARVDVHAANAGKVLSADWLGIYGNCVIVDHGMGVASLYAHLSSIDVKPGDEVTRGQTLGKSGMTGLAGGDHLHFAILVGGRPVNPVDWWDPHWIADRIDRKLAAAGASPQ